MAAADELARSIAAEWCANIMQCAVSVSVVCQQHMLAVRPFTSIKSETHTSEVVLLSEEALSSSDAHSAAPHEPSMLFKQQYSPARRQIHSSW